MRGHTRIRAGQTTAQENKTSTPETPKHGAIAAADLNNADLEGKQVPDCKIVAGFFDAGTPAAELYNGRALDPEEVSCRRPDGAIVFELAIWEDTIQNLAD
jgi:hypothetical protein